MKPKYFSILVFIIVIQIAVNYFFVVKSPLISSWDYDEVHYYYHNAKIYYDSFKEGTFFPSFFKLPTYKIKPPLIEIFAIPFMLVNSSARFALMVNSIGILILLLSLYFIGKIIKDEKAGLFSVFIMSGFPLSIIMSRAFMPAYFLAAFVSLSFLLLLLSEGLTRRNYSVLLGIVFGLGMLCKWTYFIFLIGPVVYFAIKAKREKYFNIFFKNFSVASILGILICSIWYVPFWREMFNFVFRVSWGEESFLYGPAAMLAPQSILHQIYLLNKQMGLPFFVCFSACLFLFIKSKDNNKWLLVVSILVPYLLFALVRNKHIRLAFPAFPLIAALISVCISSIKRPLLRKISMAPILLLCFFNFYMYTFPRVSLENVWPLTPVRFERLGPFILEETGAKFSKPRLSKVSLGNIEVFSYYIYESWRSKIKDEWKIREIVSKIEETNDAREKISIAVVPDLEPLWSGIFDLVQIKDISAEITILPDVKTSFYKNSYEDILRSDYVVIKKTWLSPGYYGPDPGPAIELMKKNKNNFKLVKTFTVLDGDTVLLYKRI